MKFIDSHCHVQFRAYLDDMDEVVKRSLSEDVFMISIGTQSDTSKSAIELAERYDGVWATIGLHPNHLHKQEFFDTNEQIKTRSETFDSAVYEKMVQHEKVVAIGEFGLDYYRIPDGYEPSVVIQDQINDCIKQLKFASKYNKPVVIHCRDAHEKQFELLKNEIDAGGLTKRGVIHSFTGNVEEATRYAELEFYIGVNGSLTFSKELQAVIKEVPLEQLVIETDAPYLTLPPFRGKRNEPRYVKYVAELLAEIKGVTVEEIAEVTAKNTIKLFNLPL